MWHVTEGTGSAQTQSQAPGLHLTGCVTWGLGFSLVAGAGLEALWLVEQVRRFLIVMALATEPGH